jgi:hypothetical protein
MIAIADRADAQVRWVPKSMSFGFVNCSADTVLETYLVNPDPVDVTDEFRNYNCEIVEAPDGWTSGANATIRANDSLRFRMRMRVVRTLKPVGSMEFGNYDQFWVRAEFYYLDLVIISGEGNFDSMRIGETRSQTLTILNPSTENRMISLAPIDQFESYGWSYSDFSNGPLLAPGDSTHFTISFTAPDSGTSTLAATFRDTCVALTRIFRATVLGQADVVTKQMPEMKISRRGQMLDVEGVRIGASITLTDVAGREHYSAHASGTSHTIDLSALPRGAYFVRAASDVSTQTKKMVVSR